MKTVFVDHKLDIGGGEHLWIDGNSKITAGNGTFDKPVANAFSLVSGSDCPGATPVCLKSCYTLGLKKFNPSLFEKFEHNSKVIRARVREPQTEYCADRWWESVLAVANYATEHCKAGGFRWHVSGDVFSDRYAQWIADVCDQAPDVDFWIYTRSFEYLGPLSEPNNLVVNLSADRDNLEEARQAQRDYGHRICYLADRVSLPLLKAGSVIFPDYPLRGRDLDTPTDAEWWSTLSQEQRRMVCPPDFFGQSEQARCGPCKKCLR